MESAKIFTDTITRFMRTFGANFLMKEEMLLDFTKLKGALRKVIGQLDHTNLNDLKYFNQNPSAERIATYIYENIVELLKQEGEDISWHEGKKNAYLWAIDVFETDTSRARYMPHG